MDELQSIGVGVALGLVLVSFLTFFPGEPFEYSANSSDTCLNDHASVSKDAPAQSTTSSAVNSNQQLEDQQKQIADIEQAAQRVKVQKLQELLGLEKVKIQQLVDRAKEEAVEAVTAQGKPSVSSNSSSYSTWLDRAFFTMMFGLLAWVLWADYNVNLLSVAAHLLPRETEVVRNVAAVPQGLLADFIALWD